jgi:hypothetical protein
MVDGGTPMSAGDTSMVDGSTLTVDGGTPTVDGSTLIVGGNTLTSNGQHQLGSAIARMTRHRRHQYDSAVTSRHGQVVLATSTPAQLDSVITRPSNARPFASTRRRSDLAHHVWPR